MGDPYCPFMGKKGLPWGDLDIPAIAGRVAGSQPAPAPEVSPMVDSAARALVAACKRSGVDLETAKALLEKAFSASASGRTRRK